MAKYEENIRELLPKLDFDNKYSKELVNYIVQNLRNKNVNEFYKEWLKEIVLFNISESTGSPFWVKRARERNIKAKDIEGISSVTELINMLGESDYSLLTRENGYEEYYKPKGLSELKLYRSGSSGTTGPAKIIYHSEVPLAVSAVNEYSGIQFYVNGYQGNGKRLLAFGPVGAFQKEHEYLSNLLGLKYVDLGFDTTGLKLASREEMNRRIAPKYEIAINYLQKRGGVGLMTLSKEAISMFPGDMLKHIEILKISGTEVDNKTIEKVSKEKEIVVIPSYGHFAGKSSIGFVDSKGIVYYPSLPFTNFSVINEEMEVVKYGEEGEILMIIAQPEILLIKRDDIAVRENGNEVFNFDGVRNPHR
ncbi:hypothetical protein V6M85_07670 [Sulfolobus tengchongensis]|uniref:Uncharacterized protein n=1 Tax=Sulfolobus tengchongensis TaxID=207809 RepID=A0AAX4KZL9_9CREN